MLQPRLPGVCTAGFLMRRTRRSKCLTGKENAWSKGSVCSNRATWLSLMLESSDCWKAFIDFTETIVLEKERAKHLRQNRDGAVV